MDAPGPGGQSPLEGAGPRPHRGSLRPCPTPTPDGVLGTLAVLAGVILQAVLDAVQPAVEPGEPGPEVVEPGVEAGEPGLHVGPEVVEPGALVVDPGPRGGALVQNYRVVADTVYGELRMEGVG